MKDAAKSVVKRRETLDQPQRSAGPRGAALVPPVYGIALADQPVRKRETRAGLPERLKLGIEALSGRSMDPVQVHYNSIIPAGLGALAYTQGTRIHVAPGQERQLPHEAWHVVQQAQGRVKVTGRINGMGLNDEAGLEAEASAMGARAASLSQPVVAATPGAASLDSETGHPAQMASPGGAAVIQRQRGWLRRLNPFAWDWSWVKRKGKSREAAEPLKPAEVAPPIAGTSKRETTSAGLRVGGSTISLIGSALSQLSGISRSPVPKTVSGAGSSIGAMGSAAEMLAGGYDILKTDKKRRDKAIIGLGVLGSFFNVIHSGITSVWRFGGVSHAAATAVAAPAAIAKGAADIVTGAATGGLAAYRAHKLKGIHTNPGDAHESGIARFAAQNQRIKATANLLKILGGAAGIAGGVALLAAGLSNPLGWMIMLGSTAAGVGAYLYKRHRRSKQGEILQSDVFRKALAAQGIAVPNPDKEVRKDSSAKKSLWHRFWDPIKNRKENQEVRERVRDAIAESLLSGKHDDILDLIGIRGSKKDQDLKQLKVDIARALGGES